MQESSSVYSLCGMCAVRCPIRVEVQDGKARWIEGNPHVAGIEGSMCAKGSAGLAFEADDERPQTPLLRDGPRGSGRWKPISWDQALDYIADKLRTITAEHGGRAIALADRGGPFTDLTKSFLRALGSPNYFDHDDTCGKNVNMAAQSLFGYGRSDLAYDFKNTKHIVLYGRNVFESLQVKEVNDILDARAAGAKLTYIDIRATVTASKADKFFLIRPGTDYAFNLALIHVILKEKLYDREFVGKWVVGLTELENFVRPYTPEWAAAETGISAQSIASLAREISAARPKVIFHGGWMLARYRDSFYDSRSIYILNILMGNIEVKGGLIVAKGCKDAGVPGLRSLSEAIPKPADLIVDKAMTNRSVGTGHIVNLYKAIKTGLPYPIKAFFAYRYDPIASLPDPEDQRQILDNLDLLVAIDVNYSETAWNADLILPESTYLERSNILAVHKGAKPYLMMRRQAVAPRYDSKPAWEIFTLIVERMGAGQYFPYKCIEDIWHYQLDGSNTRIEDFAAKGIVELAAKPILMAPDALKFKTASGRIDIVSTALEGSGFASFGVYETPQKPPDGHFRLAFGRSSVHTHSQTQNNIYLNELCPENVLWINADQAEELDIEDGCWVELSSPKQTGRIRAKVTPWIHPEAVFMLHGFGSQIPLKTRSFGKGLRDTRFESGSLENVDRVGGGVAYMESMVKVSRVYD